MRHNLVNVVSRSVIRAVIVLFFIACLILFANWTMLRAGVPQIETAVRKEVASLSSSNATLRTLQLGTTTKREIHWGFLTGYFIFSGSYSNQSCDVDVSWSKVDTNAPIDKIEVKTINREPKIIWSRK